MFPFVAVLILSSFFIFDEIFKLGNDIINDVIFSFANYLNYFYLFILLPFTLMDIDFAPSIIFKIAIIITPMWWYILSCVLIFFLGKAQKKEFAVKKQNL